MERESMFCRNCGLALREGAAFCPQCGTRATVQPPPPASTAQADTEFDELIARADSLTEDPVGLPETPSVYAQAATGSAPAAGEVPAQEPSVYTQSQADTPPAAPVCYGQPAQAYYEQLAAPVYYAQPAAPQKRSRTGLIVAMVITAALLLGAAAFFAWKIFLAPDDEPSSSQRDTRGDEDASADRDDADGDDSDPDADADADADKGADADSGTDGGDDASSGGDAGLQTPPDDEPVDEPPAEPEGPTQEEIFAEAAALIERGEYDRAAEMLGQLETTSEPERYEALLLAATLDPEITSINVSGFPTILITVCCNGAPDDAVSVLALTEGELELAVLETSYQTNSLSGQTFVTYVCEAAPGSAEHQTRTVTITLGVAEFALSTGMAYTTPRLESSYDIIFADVSWEGAVAECEAMGGHLMTIASQEEMDVAIELASSAGALYTWIGGYTVAGPDGITAQWITGEPMEYQRWATGEPSGADRDGTVESCMMLWNVESLGGWTWNDQRNDPIGDGFYAGQIAFICEWEDYVS